MTCNTCKANKVCDHNRYGFENCNNYIPDDVVGVVRCGEVTKVKFFRSDFQYELEKQVNDFIRNKNVISVSYATTGGFYNEHRCCVVYSVK